MDPDISPAHLNVLQTVDKYSPLLAEGKQYQFAQKIKLLSHRKSQANKLDEAELFLREGANRIMKSQKAELSLANDLIKSLLQIYEAHPNIWSLAVEKNLFTLLNQRKDNPERIANYRRILKCIKSISLCPNIAEDLMKHYEDSDDYIIGQSHALELPLKRLQQFLGKWKQKFTTLEYYAIVTRFALLRGLLTTLSQAKTLLADIPSKDPYCKFAKFMIVAVEYKSLESYDLLGVSYRKFLETDIVYDKIYQSYGVYFFKKEVGKKGLDKLLSILS